MDDRRQVAVIAGGERQAEQWIRAQADRERTNYVSIRGVQDCVGRHFAAVVRVGTYYERSHLQDIEDEVRVRMLPPPEPAVE